MREPGARMPWHHAQETERAAWRALQRGARIRKRRTNGAHGQLLKANPNIRVGICQHGSKAASEAALPPLCTAAQRLNKLHT